MIPWFQALSKIWSGVVWVYWMLHRMRAVLFLDPEPHGKSRVHLYRDVDL